MKQTIILVVALTLTVVLLALTGSDSSVKAQQNRIRVIADTGVVTLGANQKLRLSIVFDDTDGAETVAFRRIAYTPTGCSGGVCKSSISAQSQTAPVILGQGESALFDLIDPQGQVKVLSNSRNARVTISIIDSVTGEIVSYQNEYAGGASGDL